MSEEMNLYKRCKNIFKAHGVDMGGGGSGGSFVVNLTAVDEETWTSDKTYVEIKQALTNGQFVIVKFSINGIDCIATGGSLMPFGTNNEVIVWIFGASGTILCAGDEDETHWQFGG